MIAHWLVTVLGITDESGRWYAFWSGFGSDISEVAILWGILGAYRKHTCHEPRCWRIGHHPVPGTPYVACRKHHPALPDKAKPGEIARAYEEAKSGQADAA